MQEHIAARLILVILLLVGQWLLVAHASQHDVDNRDHVTCVVCLAAAGVDTQLHPPYIQAVFRRADTQKGSVAPTGHTARHSFNLHIRAPPRF